MLDQPEKVLAADAESDPANSDRPSSALWPAVKKGKLRLAVISRNHQGTPGCFSPELVFPANIESERGMIPPGRFVPVRHLDFHMINLSNSHNLWWTEQ